MSKRTASRARGKRREEGRRYGATVRPTAPVLPRQGEAEVAVAASTPPVGAPTALAGQEARPAEATGGQADGGTRRAAVRPRPEAPPVAPRGPRGDRDPRLGRFATVGALMTLARNKYGIDSQQVRRIAGIGARERMSLALEYEGGLDGLWAEIERRERA